MNDIPQELGANIDTRSKEEQAKDFAHEERGLASATGVLWEEFTDLVGLPIKRQYYTSQCVGQSTAKHLAYNNLLETGTYTDLSGEFIYYFRINKNTPNPGGMGYDNTGQIGVKKGACHSSRIEQRFRETDPDPIITDAMLTEALDARGLAYFALEDINIDTVAAMIQQQGSCILWFFFDKYGIGLDEWWRVEPTIRLSNLTVNDSKSTRHSVFGAKAGLYNGKKVIRIEDSAGNSSALNDQNRFVDAEFIKARCYKAWYIVDKKNLPNPVSPKPKVKLTTLLKVGANGEEVKALQSVLIYEGLLQISNPTGLFRGMTLKAVKQYQAKNGLKPDGIVGILTRNNINTKYE